MTMMNITMKKIKIFINRVLKLTEHGFRAYLIKHLVRTIKETVRAITNPNELTMWDSRSGEYIGFLFAASIISVVLTYDIIYPVSMFLWNSITSFSLEQITTSLGEFRLDEIFTNKNISPEPPEFDKFEQNVNLPEKDVSDKVKNVSEKPFRIRTDIIIIGLFLLIRYNCWS